MKTGLARIREERGLTQDEMAELLGMSVGGYRKIEYQRRGISLTKARDFAERLGVPIDAIIGASEESTPSQIAEEKHEPSRDEVAEAIARFLSWDNRNQEYFFQALVVARQMGSLAPESEQALRAAIVKARQEDGV